MQSKLTFSETAPRTKAVRGGGIDAVDNARHDLTLALYRTDDWRFAGTDAASSAATAALVPMPVLRLAADEGFINLDNTEQLAFGAVFHRDADAMAHVPSRLVRAGAEHSVDLQRRHTLFRVVHEERDLEPFNQRIFGVLENRFGDDGEPIAILVAALAEPMEGTGFDLPYLRVAATRARDAIGPTTRDEERLAIVFGLEPGDKFAKLHHGSEYSEIQTWCQVPDNRPN